MILAIFAHLIDYISLITQEASFDKTYFEVINLTNS